MVFSKLIVKWNNRSFRKAARRWFNDNGDETLRLDYDLDENSIVMDLGGYKGDWTYNIYNRYHCNVYIFEPVKTFYNDILARFAGNTKIHAFNCGLSNEDQTCPIYVDEDGSSEYRTGADEQKMFLKQIDKFFREHGINKIDLLKINIEGGEYDLLEHMISTGLVTEVANIQVQFHNIEGLDSLHRMERIQRELSKTHVLTYQYYPFVWENWALKGT